MLGNAEGWKKEFSPKTLDQGVATHVYASFDPLIKGMLENIPRERGLGANLILYSSQPTTEPISLTHMWQIHSKIQ